MRYPLPHPQKNLHTLPVATSTTSPLFFQTQTWCVCCVDKCNHDAGEGHYLNRRGLRKGPTFTAKKHLQIGPHPILSFIKSLTRCGDEKARSVRSGLLQVSHPLSQAPAFPEVGLVLGLGSVQPLTSLPQRKPSPLHCKQQVSPAFLPSSLQKHCGFPFNYRSLSSSLLIQYK